MWERTKSSQKFGLFFLVKYRIVVHWKCGYFFHFKCGSIIFLLSKLW